MNLDSILLVIIITGLSRALSEVGAVIIVGGNIDNLTRVMTTSIVLETSRGELSLALKLRYYTFINRFSNEYNYLNN